MSRWTDEQRCTHIKDDGNRCGLLRTKDADVCAKHARTGIPDERRCTETTATRERCPNWARRGEETCWFHDPEERCAAHITGGTTDQHRAGERCRNRRVDGTTVCDYHGAKAPDTQNAAARRVLERERAAAEEKLMAEAAKLVGYPVEDPLTELANLAGRARAIMELLEKRVERLLDADDDAPADDDGESGGKGIRYAHRAGEQIRGEVQLYERAIDRFGKLLVDFGRLNIDERLAAITQAKADMLMAAIEAALAERGITGGDALAIKQATGRHLRLVKEA